MSIILQPIATVIGGRQEAIDDNWGEVIAEIRLAESVPEAALDGISGFSHLEIIFHFHDADPGNAVFSARPRGNSAYPQTGIFAQRKRDRPNGIGLCTAALLKHEGRSIWVQGLDAIDGTPVLDIKPVMKEFAPRGEIRQPAWVSDLMKAYW